MQEELKTKEKRTKLFFDKLSSIWGSANRPDSGLPLRNFCGTIVFLTREPLSANDLIAHIAGLHSKGKIGTIELEHIDKEAEYKVTWKYSMEGQLLSQGHLRIQEGYSEKTVLAYLDAPQDTLK